MAKKETTLDDLAVMIKKGFDEIGGKLDSHAKENSKEFSDVKKDLKVVTNTTLNLEFIMTETVRRDEFLELKKRLELLEAKIG